MKTKFFEAICDNELPEALKQELARLLEVYQKCEAEVTSHESIETIRKRYNADKAKHLETPFARDMTAPFPPWEAFLREYQKRRKALARAHAQAHQASMDAAIIELCRYLRNDIAEHLEHRTAFLLEQAETFGIDNPQPDGICLAIAGQVSQLDSAISAIQKENGNSHRLVLRDVPAVVHEVFELFKGPRSHLSSGHGAGNGPTLAARAVQTGKIVALALLAALAK